eukprot:754526-Hanusia_phi.AAC.2
MQKVDLVGYNTLGMIRKKQFEPLKGYQTTTEEIEERQHCKDSTRQQERQYGVRCNRFGQIIMTASTFNVHDINVVRNIISWAHSRRYQQPSNRRHGKVNGTEHGGASRQGGRTFEALRDSRRASKTWRRLSGNDRHLEHSESKLPVVGTRHVNSDIRYPLLVCTQVTRLVQTSSSDLVLLVPLGSGSQDLSNFHLQLSQRLLHLLPPHLLLSTSDTADLPNNIEVKRAPRPFRQADQHVQQLSIRTCHRTHGPLHNLHLSRVVVDFLQVRSTTPDSFQSSVCSSAYLGSISYDRPYPPYSHAPPDDVHE